MSAHTRRAIPLPSRAYPELSDDRFAGPFRRSPATGEAEQQQRFLTEFARRLGRSHHRSEVDGDGIAHWMKYDSWRPPSRPHKLFPDTRHHGATQPSKISGDTADRNDRSAMWFSIKRSGGGVLLHQRHIRPVLVREWSTPMDGIVATIWASRTALRPVEEP